jgi:hypothetical protein
VAQVETEANVLIPDGADGELDAALAVLSSLRRIGGCIPRRVIAGGGVGAAAARIATGECRGCAADEGAVPLPIAGSVVPVAVLLSGVGELNVHWVMIVVVAVAGCAIPSMPAKSNASIAAAITRRCAATGRRLG